MTATMAMKESFLDGTLDKMAKVHWGNLAWGLFMLGGSICCAYVAAIMILTGGFMGWLLAGMWIFLGIWELGWAINTLAEVV